MSANQPVDADNEDVVVPIARGVEANRGEVSDKLRLLVDLFTHKNSQTDARLEALESNTRTQDKKFLDLRSRSDSLEISADELKKQTTGTEARLDLEAANIRSLEGATRTLEEKTSSLDTSIAIVVGGINSAAERLTSLEPKVGDLDKAVAYLDSRSAALGEKQDETQQQTRVLERRATELEGTDKLHAARTDGLETRIKWSSRIAGHAIFIVAVVAGVSYWHSSKNLETASLAFNEKLSSVESQLSANLDNKVAAIHSASSQSLDEKLGALDSELSSQISASDAERSKLLNLTQEAQQKIALLQQQFAESRINSTEQQRENTILAQSLQGIVEHLLLVDARFTAELSAINERFDSAGEGLDATAVDMSVLNNESWLKTQQPNHFAIQLAGVYRKSDLASLIGRHSESLPLEDLSYFQRVRNGRDWYILLLGNYPSFQQASNTLESLPASLQGNSPFIRTYKSIQESISL